MKRKVDKLKKDRGKLEIAKTERIAAVKVLEEAKALAAARIEADLKKQQQAAEKAEMSKPMTDAGVLILVESVAKFQHRFDNTSDKADAVWQHMHAHFMKSVTKGELPESDGRSAAALQKRWNTELGEFRLWCATVP